MKRIMLSMIVIILHSCGNISKTQTMGSEEFPIMPINEILENIDNIPFSKANIACPSGNGLYGKFPLKQKWTLVSLYRNQIITIETVYHYFDVVENLNTSLVEQGKKLTFHFDIAFKGTYSEKDIEILSLTPENDDNIINMIKQNMPKDISAKEFWKKYNPEYEMRPFQITNIQLFSFTNNENKLWVAHCNFQFENAEEDEYTGLVGITTNKEIVLLSGYCVEENAVYVLRLKDEFLLYVENDTCGEGAIVTRRLYKLTTDFEIFFEETIGYD